MDEFVETTGSSQHAAQRRELMERVEALQRGDRLIVSELSRLGRSLGQILHVTDRLIHKGVRLGRPKGARGKSKLDGREDDIRTFLTKGVSKASFARIMEVSPHPASLRQDAETSGQDDLTAVTWRESTFPNNGNCSVTIGYPMFGS